MGLSTVATVLGVGSSLNNIFNRPKAPTVQTMPYQEAYAQAGAQLNPLYDQRMKDVLANVQNDLIARGFSGQKAGTELATETAAENERQRIAALAGLAQSIQQGYNDQSYRNAALEYESKLKRHNLLSEGLSGAANWLSGKTWVKDDVPSPKGSIEGKKVVLPPIKHNYKYRGYA